jgi:hypothetical protein
VALVHERTISTERLPLVGSKLVPTFAGRRCRVGSTVEPHGRILGFLDRSRFYFFQVALQLYSWGWVGPVPDPLLLRKSGSAGNRTQDIWICSQGIVVTIETIISDQNINGKIIYHTNMLLFSTFKGLLFIWNNTG